MNVSATQILAIGAVGLAGAVLYYGPGKIKAAAGKVGEAVNPLDRDNLVNRAVNNVGDVLDDADDNNSFSVGSALYDLVQRIRGIPPYDPNAPVRSVASDEVGGPPV